jgi:predicted ATPase/DNA-binding SARP family transcriptional activator
MLIRANLPKCLPPLLGREGELGQVGPALGHSRLLTLTGPGGVGKTRLAQQLACDAQPKFPDGVWWADLGALTEPEALADYISATMRAPDAPAGPAIDRLQNYVGDRTVLLVLDNCEHLIEAVACLCEAFLQACPTAQILATSRQALGVSYESVWLVPPLAVPPVSPEKAFTDLDAYGAVQLFAYRAGSIAPGFELTSQNCAAVARVCRRLDGLPLALELAASCLNILSVEQLDAELERTNHLLVHGQRTAPPRQHSLDATIEWSYNSLTLDEQTLFRRLCQLRDSFDLELAARVGDFEHGVMLNHLKHLVDKSLVQVVTSDGVPRYRILQTLAHFGRERLCLSGEEYQTSVRYCDWGRALVEAVVREPECQRTSFDSVELNLGHLRGILHWMLHHGMTQEATTWVTALQGFWRERGRLAEGRRWLEVGLTGRDAISALVRGRALLALGVYASWQGDDRQAITNCKEALRLFGDLQRPRGVAMSLFRLGSAERRSGEYEDATAHLTMSFEAFAALGEAAGMDMARYGLGLVALAQGDAGVAITQFEECLANFRARGDVVGCAPTLMSLGVAALERGDFALAEQRLNETLEYNRALKDTFAVGYALVYLGQALYLQGRNTEARACHSDALALACSTSTPELLNRLFDGLAALAASDGDLRSAAYLWGAAEAIHTTGSTRYWPAERKRLEEALAAVRPGVDNSPDETFVAAWTMGRAMVLDEALKLARQVAQTLPVDSGVDAAAQERSRGHEARTEATSIPPLRIHALGAVCIQRGKYEVTTQDFTYSKGRELLFYLLLNGPRSKQQIGLALWPDISEEQLRTTFRVVVYHLRRALGGSSRVVRVGGRYKLVRNAADWFDVEEFETAFAEAKRCLQGESERAIAQLEAARSLYRGDVCEDLTASEWLLEAQSELRRKELSVLISLGDAYLEVGQPRQALESFLEAVKYDRYCEDAHRGVLRSYLLLHDYTQAAHYYQHLRAQFEQELDVALAPETQAVLWSALRIEAGAAMPGTKA